MEVTKKKFKPAWTKLLFKFSPSMAPKLPLKVELLGPFWKLNSCSLYPPAYLYGAGAVIRYNLISWKISGSDLQIGLLPSTKSHL